MSRVEVRIETPLAGLRPALIERAVLAVLAAEHADLEIGVTVTDDARIREINREHLDHDWPTDVIAFDLRDEAEASEVGGEDGDGDDGDPMLDRGVDGDVVVSAETARREAAARGLDPIGELLLYCVHGTLHLLGWEDGGDEQREAMHARQAELLAELGYETRP